MPDLGQEQPPRATPAAEKHSVPRSRFTYFFMMPDPYEQRIMLAYLAEKYPDSQAKKVSELRIDRLTDLHAVIVLVRPKPSAAATQFKNQMGLSEFTHHEPETKMAEVREARPILIKDFWREAGEDSVSDGELDTSAFITAVSQAASPITTYWHPDQLPGILKLSYV